jgi:hypothetical protein
MRNFFCFVSIGVPLVVGYIHLHFLLFSEQLITIDSGPLYYPISGLSKDYHLLEHFPPGQSILLSRLTNHPNMLWFLDQRLLVSRLGISFLLLALVSALIHSKRALNPG